MFLVSKEFLLWHAMNSFLFLNFLSEVFLNENVIDFLNIYCKELVTTIVMITLKIIFFHLSQPSHHFMQP